MRLLNPDLRSKKLLSISKLDTVFETFDLEIDAVRSLSSTPLTDALPVRSGALAS